MQLTDAIDAGLATMGWNERPEGWRVAWFNGLLAYVDPEAPPIDGEVTEDEEND